MTDILLVSFGALLGANARFLIYKKLEQINLNKNFILLIINTLSSFLLGYSISFLSRYGNLNFSYKLGLFFAIGLLGSLSTFSTFIYDLFNLLIKSKFSRALQLFISSSTLGIIFFGYGFSLAKQ